MNVVYATPMINKINGAISDALAVDRHIAYIELTQQEYNQLHYEMSLSHISQWDFPLHRGGVFTFQGTQIRVVR